MRIIEVAGDLVQGIGTLDLVERIVGAGAGISFVVDRGQEPVQTIIGERGGLIFAVGHGQFIADLIIGIGDGDADGIGGGP